MTKPHASSRPHSAEFFGDWRDYWWNHDYLALLARRWGFCRARCALDVGCGVGHWSRALIKVLPAGSKLIGVDREAKWVELAARRARQAGLGRRLSYQTAAAETLPFPDGSFDLVTCQTVLMHVREPKLVLAEMLRVLRPGGWLLAAEPNNRVSGGVLSSINHEESVQTTLARLRFELLCERGKRALGLGDNSMGDLLPGWLAGLGCRDISASLNDKLIPLFPPYAALEQKVFLKQIEDWIQREVGIDAADETRRFFLAGGGSVREFSEHRRRIRQEGRALLAAVRKGDYHCANGHLHYVVCARAPKSR
ncbi:MAG: class I SAM-dependent methyltransferase [Elusimicrobia bacterium]|nr:class I SAM-dependent methyltransferase [Elusimicrobiota bacterium]